MNEYKITYSGESEGYRLVVDRTEAAAKKYFREQAKELDLGRITIDDVELVSDNAMATKRNERETLEVIRQLVADLGEQSYLATTFQGCFEIAEENIENDFADSLRGRLDAALKKIDKLEDQVKEMERKLKTAELNERDLRSAIEKAKADASKTITALQLRQLSEDDLEDIRQLLDDRATEADEKAEKAAAEIVRFAEATGLPEFRQAVTDHRNYIKDAKYYRELLGRVVKAQVANHAGA